MYTENSWVAKRNKFSVALNNLIDANNETNPPVFNIYDFA
jgi:hypothetical protein